MILLREQKLLFLKPRKVAGTSFEIALSKFAGADDVITPIMKVDEPVRARLGFRGPQNYRWSVIEGLLRAPRETIVSLRLREMPRKFYNHISAADTKVRVGDAVWDACRKVSIVRNPYDMVVSSYFWRQRNLETLEPFESWCLANQSVLTQNNLQYLIDGRNVIDTYIRFEHFAEDIAALEAEMPELAGLRDCFAQITTKAGTRPKNASAKELFGASETARKLVERLNAAELERFGYTL
ncbi:MAG TPA: hypothetical protein PKD99_09760 [Sphingopyxis sp.]|nr:hypothetical protein [Sphingopyxis sp.]HMQ18475.1 hypothetical protein [Sphingopyxis sp.]